ncbi:hypothetical protein ACTXT7_005181 [Hymenolepis weldensis]
MEPWKYNPVNNKTFDRNVPGNFLKDSGWIQHSKVMTENISPGKYFYPKEIKALACDDLKQRMIQGIGQLSGFFVALPSPQWSEFASATLNARISRNLTLLFREAR